VRLAIITAYFQEDRATIERCIESVRKQSVRVEHILVADGHPQDWVAASGLRHLALDRAHGDFGDTPRLAGLVLAIREGFDAIQFLDADNVIYPHHAAMAAALLQDTGAHMLVLKEHHLRPDGSILNYTSAHYEALSRIDTNAYLFARPSFPTALKWSLIPRELSYMGDRVFRSVFSKVGHPVAVAPEPTVGYASMWADVYRAVGEEPPPGCRDLTEQVKRAKAWWLGLDDGRREEIQAMLGVTITVA
jgi:glycosyltransferase involved in cell wall biosynthesis